MPKRILVTGGAGFIGSFLVDALVERGHEVTVIDNLEEQVHGGRQPDYLNKGAQYVWANIIDYEALEQVVVGAEVIFHQAAVVGVGQSQYQIRRYVQANSLGTANLLDILANHGHRCTKLVLAGSMSTYGEGLYQCAVDGPVRPSLRSEAQMKLGDWELHCPNCTRHVEPVSIPETAEQHCTSIYAITKKNQEDMFMTFGRTYGLPTVVLRYFNVYGPRQSLSNPYTGVAAIFMSRIKNNQSPIIYEDGCQLRDFVSVHDIVQANILAMEKDKANGEVFNVGSASAISIRQIAEQLAKLYEKPVQPEITRHFRKGDVRHCFADITKIKGSLGYQPRVDFATGTRELLNWSQKVEAIDRFDTAANELSTHGLA